MVGVHGTSGHALRGSLSHPVVCSCRLDAGSILVQGACIACIVLVKSRFQACRRQGQNFKADRRVTHTCISRVIYRCREMVLVIWPKIHLPSHTQSMRTLKQYHTKNPTKASDAGFMKPRHARYHKNMQNPKTIPSPELHIDDEAHSVSSLTSFQNLHFLHQRDP